MTLNRLPDYVAGMAAIAMLISVLIQIATRWAGRPVAWTEEGTRFLFIWIVFLGISIGFRRAESARVTVFLRWMPRAGRRIGVYLYGFTTIGFFLVVLITGSQVVLQQIRGTEMGSALMIPMWIVGICVPLTALLGILGVVQSFLLHPELVRGKED